MADSKISALTAATTPLAGTEVVPLVQSGTTKKVTVSDLTAGRVTEAYMFRVQFSSATAWAPNSSVTQNQVINSAAAANSTALYQAQVVDDASTTGGAIWGAVAVPFATSGGYSADFVVANRKTGTYVETLRVKYNGPLMPFQAPTASAPPYIKGGLYFDTTLNKLRVGGATGWETVTSV